jgi:hypothetical protein
MIKQYAGKKANENFKKLGVGIKPCGAVGYSNYENGNEN